MSKQWNVLTEQMKDKKSQFITGELSIENGWLMIKDSATGTSKGFVLDSLISLTKIN